MGISHDEEDVDHTEVGSSPSPPAFAVCAAAAPTEQSDALSPAQIVAQLTAHSGRGDLEAAMRWCKNLRRSADSLAENKDALGDHRACDAVLNFLRHHGWDPAAAKEGCKAVRSLADEHAANRAALTSPRACTALVGVVRAHEGDASVALEGCEAARVLGGDSSDPRAERDCLVQAGLCQVLVAVLRAHWRDEGVAEAASQLVFILAGDGAANCGQLEGACGSLGKVAGPKSAASAEVQEEARAALKALRDSRKR